MYRTELITFCGSNVKVEFDVNGISGKECFNNYENGVYKFREIMKTRHPNIVKGVLISKKGWRLWINEWSQGIVEGVFTRNEILEDIKGRNLEMPESMLLEFENTIQKMRREKYGAIV
jgi:hypothetical protein